MNEFCRRCPFVSPETTRIFVGSESYLVSCSPDSTQVDRSQPSQIDVTINNYPNLDNASGFCDHAAGFYNIVRTKI